MQRRTAITLFALTTLYALTLRLIPYEPDWTWATVVVGTALCLSAAALDIRARTERWGGATWHSYERSVWASFVIGGTPIVIWQVAEMVVRRMG